jgi:putative ABC transport system permease protein
MISYSLWQQRYGGQRSVIGRQLLLNGDKYTVVGVMPAGFQFMQSYVRLWVPIALSPEELAQRDSHYLNVVASMKPGANMAQANADTRTIQQRIAHDYPTPPARSSAYVMPLRSQLAGDVRRPLLVLLVAIGVCAADCLRVFQSVAFASDQ